MGNTPGVLTETTAQTAVTLTFAAALLRGCPAWNRPDVLTFLGDQPPPAAPSILNAGELGIPLYNDE